MQNGKRALEIFPRFVNIRCRSGLGVPVNLVFRLAKLSSGSLEVTCGLRDSTLYVYRSYSEALGSRSRKQKAKARKFIRRPSVLSNAEASKIEDTHFSCGESDVKANCTHLRIQIWVCINTSIMNRAKGPDAIKRLEGTTMESWKASGRLVWTYPLLAPAPSRNFLTGSVDKF